VTNELVRLVTRVENTRSLDGVDRRLWPAAGKLIGRRWSRALLHGHWLGHAVHPLLTDFPLGMWMSGTVLHLTGGDRDAGAARRLIGWGLLAAVPTALTGAAEWAGVDELRDRRTGLVHASLNVTALALYAGSWIAPGRARSLAVTGGLVATAGGYFGGHLTEVRKVSSRHPEFDAESSVDG